MRSHVAGFGPRSRGFTLVEILVVVVIMAVVISMAVLSIGVTGHDSQLDQEDLRIQGLLSLLHDRATLEGRDFGMRVLPTGYEFVYYDTRRARWQRLDQEREFRHRELPKGVSFQLELDSQVVVLKPIDPNLIDDTAPPPPQIAIAASGDATPFRLTLLRPETAARASVSSDTTGKLTVQSSDHPNPEKKT
jgi:general secretion pathway protein H